MGLMDRLGGVLNNRMGVSNTPAAAAAPAAVPTAPANAAAATPAAATTTGGGGMNDSIGNILNRRMGGGGTTPGSTGADPGLFSQLQYANPYSQSSSSGGGSNQSQSGVDWNDPMLQEAKDMILGYFKNLPGMADEYGRKVYNQYNRQMQDAMGKGLQGTLNEMASKGMIGSSDMNSIMKNTQADIMQNIGEKAYQASSDAELLKFQVPSLLQNLAQMFQKSTSSGSTSSSSSSYQEDPIAKYQVLSNLINSGAMA